MEAADESTWLRLFEGSHIALFWLAIFKKVLVQTLTSFGLFVHFLARKSMANNIVNVAV